MADSQIASKLEAVSKPLVRGESGIAPQAPALINSLFELLGAVLVVLAMVVPLGLRWLFARWDRAVDSWFLPKSRQGEPSGAGASEASGPTLSQPSEGEIRSGDLRVLRSIAADPWWGPESEQEAATQRWLAQQKLIANSPAGLRLTPEGERALSRPAPPI